MLTTIASPVPKLSPNFDWALLVLGGYIDLMVWITYITVSGPHQYCLSLFSLVFSSVANLIKPLQS